MLRSQQGMPEICRFYGIVIRMYFMDHAPPHFHAEYNENEALIAIDSMAVVSGSLPVRARRLVMEWASMHHDELRVAWGRVKRMESPGRIEPLQ